MADPILTDYRRDALAHTLFDVAKIIVAAAFASRFFFEFGTATKWVAVAAAVGVAIAAFFITPPKKP